MAITRLNKHDNCPVQLTRLAGNTHYARLSCAVHHTHIQWVSARDFKLIKKEIEKCQK